MQSLICTYQHRNRIVSRVGTGRDFADALRDADGKLPDGRPVSDTVTPHRILLTHGRELRFDRDGDRFRVAYYVPDADRDLLRQLATKANRGDLAAAEQLHSLPRTRTVGADSELRYAIEEAVAQQDERRARKIACELADYAAGMGWA